MKELLQQFSAYNIWANNLLLNVILSLPEELQHKQIPSSFDSLYKTVLHLWDAESIWWQRMKLVEQPSRPSVTFGGSMKEVASNLIKQNNQWHAWLLAAQEHHMQHEFIYRNSKREQSKLQVAQVILHLSNHATYHRGQLVNMLRQLGVEKIPQSDFSFWCRKK